MPREKMLTKYQRSRLAVELAQDLKLHPDPKVQTRALEIEYALAAPSSTLRNLLDEFPQDIVRRVRKTPTPGDALLEDIRDARRAKTSGV